MISHVQSKCGPVCRQGAPPGVSHRPGERGAGLDRGGDQVDREVPTESDFTMWHWEDLVMGEGGERWLWQGHNCRESRGWGPAWTW